MTQGLTLGLDAALDIGQITRSGSSLTIEETEPARAGARPRVLVLLGPGLPFMGAEWGTENNIVTTWYQGNREGSQQILGPREMPSAWEGEWRRTLMGKSPSYYFDQDGVKNTIVSPHLLRDLFDDIMRAGIRLRVTWSVDGTAVVGNPRNRDTRDSSYKIVREGRVKQFRTPIDRHTDIKWSAEFHWVSRGGAKTNRVTSVREDQDLARASNALEASINLSTSLAQYAKFITAVDGATKSATNLTLGQLESMVNSIVGAPMNIVGAPLGAVKQFTNSLQRITSDFKRLGDIVNRIRSAPAAIANTVVDFARNTVSIANNFVDTMSRRPAELNALKPKVASLLRATNYLGRVQFAAQQNARRGYELEASVHKTISAGGNRGALTVRESSSTRAGDLLAIHVSKTGDTPQRLSTRYYRNPDQGAVILRANRLPLHTASFRRGQILVIPVLTNATTQRGRV